MPIDASRHSDPRFPQLGFLIGSFVLDFLPIPFTAYALAHMDEVQGVFNNIHPFYNVNSDNSSLSFAVPSMTPATPSISLAKATYAVALTASCLATVRTLYFIAMHMSNKPSPSAAFYSTLPIILLYIPVVGMGWNHQLYPCDAGGDSCKDGVFDLTYATWSDFNTGRNVTSVAPTPAKTIYSAVCFSMLGFGWVLFTSILLASHYWRARNPQSPYHGQSRLTSEPEVQNVEESKVAAQ
jgi:hypothetical protein